MLNELTSGFPPIFRLLRHGSAAVAYTANRTHTNPNRTEESILWKATCHSYTNSQREVTNGEQSRIESVLCVPSSWPRGRSALVLYTNSCYVGTRVQNETFIGVKCIRLVLPTLPTGSPQRILLVHSFDSNTSKSCVLFCSDQLHHHPVSVGNRLTSVWCSSSVPHLFTLLLFPAESLELPFNGKPPPGGLA